MHVHKVKSHSMHYSNNGIIPKKEMCNRRMHRETNLSVHAEKQIEQHELEIKFSSINEKLI